MVKKGKAGNDKDFWLSVELAFAEGDNLFYDTLQFQDDDVLEDCNDINPDKVAAHDWKMLHQIWKLVNADYKAAINKFTMSRTHMDDFYSFCNGKLATYHLCPQLQNQPDLTATVEANLPDKTVFMSSTPMDDFVIHTSITSDCMSTTSGTTSTKNSSDTLCELVSQSQATNIFSKEKMCFMEKDDVRKEQEIHILEKDDKDRTRP